MLIIPASPLKLPTAAPLLFAGLADTPVLSDAEDPDAGCDDPEEAIPVEKAETGEGETVG